MKLIFEARAQISHSLSPATIVGQRIDRCDRGSIGLARLRLAFRLLENLTTPGQPPFLARGTRAHFLEAPERRIDSTAHDLQIDRGERERNGVAQPLESLIQSANGLIDMLRARGNQCLRTLQIKIGVRLGRGLDRLVKISDRRKRLTTRLQGKCAGHESLNIRRLDRQKSIQSLFRVGECANGEEEAAAHKINRGPSRRERGGFVVIGTRCRPVTVRAIQLATAEIKLGVLWSARDLQCYRLDLLGQITMRMQRLGNPKQRGHGNGRKKPKPRSSDSTVAREASRQPSPALLASPSRNAACSRLAPTEDFGESAHVQKTRANLLPRSFPCGVRN